MPRPREQAGAAPDGAADKPCGYCGKEIDPSDQYITGTCSRCGTTPYHPECVTKLLTSKFEKAGSSKRATHFHFYETRPHLDFVSRVGKCPAGSYLPDGPTCPGYLQVADLIKPKKAAPAPPPPQPQRGPRTKQQQQQQQPKAAPAPKPRPPQVPAPPRVIGARPAAVLAPAQPGLLRDRLGVRLPQGGDPGAAGQTKKKKKPLEFPGGLRPEELTLCRQLETLGQCSLPNCVFAHSEEELEQREDEYRAEQARLKKEQRRAAALEKQRSMEEAAAASTATTAGASAAADSGTEAAEASGWGTASEAGRWEGDAASGSEAAVGGSGGGGDVWAELLVRARGSFPSVPASSAASVEGSAQGEVEGDSGGGSGSAQGNSPATASWQQQDAARGAAASALQGGSNYVAQATTLAPLHEPALSTPDTASPQPLYSSFGSSSYNAGPPGASYEGGGWHPAAAGGQLPAATHHSQGEYFHTSGMPAQHGQLSNQAAVPLSAVPAPPVAAASAAPASAIHMTAVPASPPAAVPHGFLEGYQAGQAAIMAQLGRQQQQEQQQQQAGWAATEGFSTHGVSVDWGALLGSASGGSSAAATHPSWATLPQAQQAQQHEWTRPPPEQQQQQQQQGVVSGLQQDHTTELGLEDMLALLCST